MPAQSDIKSVCLSEFEAAEYINMSVSFLRYHRQRGFVDGKAQGPRYVKLGQKCVRYLLEDLDNWLKNSRCHCLKGL